MNNQQPYRITLIPAPEYTHWASPIAHALKSRNYPITIVPEAETRLNYLEGDYAVYLGSLADDTAIHLNKVCHHQNISLVIVTPAAESFQIGPAVLYGRLPCVQCYQETSKFFPFNGFQRLSDASGAIYRKHSMAALSDRFACDLEAFIHGDTSSTLLRGEIAYLDPQTQAPQRTVHGWRYGGCSVCSAWAYHPAEVYVAKHKGD